MTNEEVIKEFENALTIDGYRINTEAFKQAIKTFKIINEFDSYKEGYCPICKRSYSFKISNDYTHCPRCNHHLSLHNVYYKEVEE